MVTPRQAPGLPRRCLGTATPEIAIIFANSMTCAMLAKATTPELSEIASECVVLVSILAAMRSSMVVTAFMSAPAQNEMRVWGIVPAQMARSTCLALASS